MKSKLFRKAANKVTALAVGSLVVLSGQALAFSPDNQEMTNKVVADGSELLIAQCMPMKCEEVEPEEKAAIAESIALAESLTEDALAVAQASSLPRGGKDAIASALASAKSLLGDANAIAQSTALTEGDAAVIATSVAAAESLTGAAEAIAQSLAIGEDGQAVAQSIAEAKSGTGEAKAIATSVAS